jgi:hypothetical protein
VGDVAGERGAFRRGIDAYNRGEVEAVVQEHDPDVEWHPALLQLLGGEATVYRGHEGTREMMRDAAEAFAELHFEVLEIRDLGDRSSANATSAGVARQAEPRPKHPSPFWSISETARSCGS